MSFNCKENGLKGNKSCFELVRGSSYQRYNYSTCMMKIQGKLILVQMSESFKLVRLVVSGSQLYLPYPVIQIIFNILPNNKTGLVCQNRVMEWKDIWSTRKSDFDVCELILIGFQRKWRVLNGKHLHHTQSFPSLKKAVIDKNYSHPSWFFSQVTMLLLTAVNKSDLLSTTIQVIPTPCLKLNFILSTFSDQMNQNSKKSLAGGKNKQNQNMTKRNITKYGQLTKDY